MPINSALADKTAITLSAVCALHCLLTPLLLLSIPSLTSLGLGGEQFHQAILLFVLPVSLYALTIGCKQHQRYPVLIFGFIGLFLLVFAALHGHELFGHEGEILLTVLGSSVIIAGHVWNYRLCNACGHCRD